MIYPAAAVGSTGTITINLAEVWRHHWARMWSDLGRLAYVHENEEHIPKHEVPRFIYGDLGFCECWNCRVVTAWQKRHEPVRTPKYKRRK